MGLRLERPTAGSAVVSEKGRGFQAFGSSPKNGQSGGEVAGEKMWAESGPVRVHIRILTAAHGVLGVRHRDRRKPCLKGGHSSEILSDFFPSKIGGKVRRRFFPFGIKRESGCQGTDDRNPGAGVLQQCCHVKGIDRFRVSRASVRRGHTSLHYFSFVARRYDLFTVRSFSIRAPGSGSVQAWFRAEETASSRRRDDDNSLQKRPQGVFPTLESELILRAETVRIKSARKKWSVP